MATDLSHEPRKHNKDTRTTSLSHSLSLTHTHMHLHAHTKALSHTAVPSAHKVFTCPESLFDDLNLQLTDSGAF